MSPSPAKKSNLINEDKRDQCWCVRRVLHYDRASLPVSSNLREWHAISVGLSKGLFEQDRARKPLADLRMSEKDLAVAAASLCVVR